MSDAVPYTREELDELAKQYAHPESQHARLLATARAGIVDSERLDWLEANRPTVDCSHDITLYVNGDLVSDQRTTFRAAIDIARTRGTTEWR